MSRIDVDGLAWEVRVRGRGPGLLLVHGFLGRGATWAGHATALARSFRVVVVDLPGHGRSGIPTDPARAGVEGMAADLAVILDRLGLASVALLGYSLGARLALRLAVTEPDLVDRLVLESPSAGIASSTERAIRRAADEARATMIERSGIAAFVDEWEREPVFASQADLGPARAARLRAERLRNRAAGVAASLRNAGQGTMEPLHGRLADIAIPTLVIAGGRDPVGLARARDVAAGIPGARLEVVASAGHTPHLERPSIFRSITLSFLHEEAAA